MSVKIHVGEALETLRTLPNESVNMILSSPPYYGLRDYGTATWEGGDPNHEHDRVAARNGRGGSGSPGKQTEGAFPSDLPAEICSCGAVRVDHQIGLEETPEQFVEKLVAVFSAARRVLRDDGVAFINIGDSYARQGGRVSEQSRHWDGRESDPGAMHGTRHASDIGLKPKDLIGVPWMLAFALRADGWYLRQEIIWSKPNPMPESVRDRCTKAHEHVFLLSKSQRYDWYADAIAEPSIYAGQTVILGDKSLSKAQADGNALARSGNANVDSVTVKDTRNKRDVWTIPTEPSSIAHYAMMPTELAKTCILAGCPVGGTVLDPFGGAGTTGLVADRLQRNAVLIELSPTHAQTARDRLSGEMGLFSAVS